MNSASANERFKFTEKERDQETDYDYFGARYYDAEYGRWMSIDPLAERKVVITQVNGPIKALCSCIRQKKMMH